MKQKLNNKIEKRTEHNNNNNAQSSIDSPIKTDFRDILIYIRNIYGDRKKKFYNNNNSK